MRARLIMGILTCLFLLTSCSNQNDKITNNEIKRLAQENIQLRQEQMDLKSKVEQLELDVQIAQENLELAQMTQAEVIKNMARENLNMLKGMKAPTLETLIDLGTFAFSRKNSIEYGRLIYESIQASSMRDFLDQLETREIQNIDNVTLSLCEYVKVNQLKEPFLNRLEKLEMNDSKSGAYILARIVRLLEA